MSLKGNTNSDSLRWVVLLLATAVILPTVCLLWFMTQAVKNERLAVRQKLETWYRKQCESAIDDKYIQLCLSQDGASGILVYDSTGKQTFPVAEDDFSGNALLDKAAVLEFQKKDYSKAIEEYQVVGRSAAEPTVGIQADISIARCMAHLDRTGEAIGQLEGLLAKYEDSLLTLRSSKSRAYLLLLELMQKAKHERFAEILQKTYDYVKEGVDDIGYAGEPNFLACAVPSELQSFVLKKYVEYAKTLPFDQMRERYVRKAGMRIKQLDYSIGIADDYKTPSFVNKEGANKWGGIFSLDARKPLYGRYHEFRGHIKLLVFPLESMSYWLNHYVDKFKKLPSVCQIYDAQGRLAAGSSIRNPPEPFIKMPLSGWLPGWTIHLFVQDLTFDNAAQKQAAIYKWTGVLVVGLMLLAGMVAIGTVGRQMRMNRLKNDFIATVTHELKTPLASMRLLVETLLDGSFTDQVRCREYLELICRENHRLSRMIDSFLTFSRMERGKQVFDMAKVAPAEVAEAAAEAVQAKFNGKKCRFSVTVGQGLASIYADKDAMVTVLVNLLDNACKYSGEEKEIELRVFGQEGCVCFSVADNGIGMTRRQMRRIFDKFYQADTSLARRAEGCGLGLSIVKYILDAHNATITVESKSGKGSVFTVKIPKKSCY